MLFDAIADLELEVEEYALHLRTGETTSDFTRATTVISLEGGGETGRGEDVIYDEEPHHTLTEADDPFDLAGGYTVASFSDHLDSIDLFPADAPTEGIFTNYRRWAFESAALDLALRQAGQSLGEVLDRTPDPVRFVVSTRLGDPPSVDRVLDWLERDPSLEFKLDPTEDWTPSLIDTLADTDAVRIIDLKGQYEDQEVSLAGEPRLYSLLLDRFPAAVVEDPDVTPATRPVLEPETDRLSWDYPIRSVETIEALPWEPAWLNIKPSRFGTLRSLLESVEYCLDRDITLYGGGQFELGPGRGQLHHLASLFYPDGPNDVAPRGYNQPESPADVPGSPLEPPADHRGFGWN